MPVHLFINLSVPGNTKGPLMWSKASSPLQHGRKKGMEHPVFLIDIIFDCQPVAAVYQILWDFK